MIKQDIDLPISQFTVFSLVLPFMREELARTVQNVRALRPDAVDVIADFRKPTVFERAHFIFHEFFEAVSGQLFVFDMVRFVFF